MDTRVRLLKTFYCLASKCADNNEAFSPADQTSLSPQSTIGSELELSPNTTFLAIDHQFRGFGAFVKCICSSH